MVRMGADRHGRNWEIAPGPWHETGTANLVLPPRIAKVSLGEAWPALPGLGLCQPLFRGLEPAEIGLARQRKFARLKQPLDRRGALIHFAFMAKKQAPIKERYSKTQILDQIAADTGLARKQVASVLDSLGDIIGGHIDKRGVGEFVLPGLMKISTIKKPAVKARKGINPFTKEEVTFKAKPASTAVKVRPLKALKDMVL